MNVLSVCSGIGAPECAWSPTGFEFVGTSEIDAFPSAVLAHHYPHIPNLGDMTQWKDWPDANIDVLVGGTPCQSFSVAGLRQGLADPRGGLTRTFVEIAARYRPQWVVWENVAGILSSGRGRDFGSFLGALVELGYGFAYRVLDAQYFGVAQRRRRVFVVGHLGDWRRAAAVLFERESLQGHPPPRREAGQVAPTIPSRRTVGGGLGTDFDLDGGAIAFDARQDPVAATDQSLPLGAKDTGHAIAIHDNAQFDPNVGPSGNFWRVDDAAYTLKTHSRTQAVAHHFGVRRLTPRECERLQGFPDDYTAIGYRDKPAADSPRYKALGNSMAVPVVQWIGKRIIEFKAGPQRR